MSTNNGRRPPGSGGAKGVHPLLWRTVRVTRIDSTAPDPQLYKVVWVPMGDGLLGLKPIYRDGEGDRIWIPVSEVEMIVEVEE